MRKYILRRFIETLPVIFGVVTLVFLLIHFIPGDPIDMMLGESTQRADREKLRHLLGLDLPLVIQYLNFWKNIFFHSWGQSIVHSKSVLSLILECFPSTLLLSLSSLLLACLLSFPLGVLAAYRAGTWVDTLATSFSLLGMSVPLFVTAPLGVLEFSIRLRWLPVAGAETFAHLVLPSLCLSFGISGILTRMIRNSVLENLGEDFVRTARSKGLSEYSVLFKHTLRNALIPVITTLGNVLGGLLAGAVLTETLFDWPGIGNLFFKAFQSRDFPLIQGIVLWISAVYVLISFLLDICYSLADPRILLEVEAA